MRPSSPAYDKIVPDLAEKWAYSSGGKTLTCTLRQGVKFHNGNDSAAAAVKFTLSQIRGAITEGPGALGLAVACDAKERVVVSPIAWRFCC